MSITTSDYLSVKNPDLKAKKFTITIDGGYEASVITYGAVITDLIVPDKDGKPTTTMFSGTERSFLRKRLMLSSSIQRSPEFPAVTAELFF